jgi:transposase
MRALDREVIDAVWKCFEPLLPEHIDNHPKGGHRPRIADRVVFHVVLVRLVSGCSWVDAEALCGWQVSDTTVRARFKLWVAHDVFRRAFEHALDAYDRIIGLDLSEVAVDGSLHKAPCGGEGTGPNPTDRGRSGWKWSIGTDRNGIPVGWATDSANRHDIPMLAPTLTSIASRHLLVDVETIHLDRGYDANTVRATLATYGLDDAVIAKRRKRGEPAPVKVGLGLRWPVERTNSWMTNYGQLRRNTDRQPAHREAQLALALVFILAAKLIDWRNRWNPPS